MGAALIALSASPALAQSAVQTAFNYNLVGHECAEPACGCEEPSCGCDNDYGCGGSGFLDGCLLSDCCLGEPWDLGDELCGPCRPFDVGGWTQIGYHSQATRLSNEYGDLRAFNDVPHQVNLHQQYFYAEKVAEAPACGYDWGFRADIMYGTDAQKTQAFGNPRAATPGFGTFDASLDHGVYGWAIPQLYAELATGDWSFKVGHFYTIVGYEVVTAPDNFFYSHSYTMFNSEPFTHTGVLGAYNGIDDVTLYAGWTLGWDTGFDQSNSGNNFLGGFSTNLMDDVSMTYILTAGNFGARSGGESGYSHSIVFDVALSQDLKYVMQSDVVSYDDDDNHLGSQVGINQYLFYTVNDCLALGTRMEWWKSDGIVGEDDSASFYGLTYGANYRFNSNLIVRPEVRHNWTPAEDAYEANTGFDFNQTVFGVDAILTY
jgi:hypothetical protein